MTFHLDYGVKIKLRKPAPAAGCDELPRVVDIYGQTIAEGCAETFRWPQHNKVAPMMLTTLLILPDGTLWYTADPPNYDGVDPDYPYVERWKQIGTDTDWRSITRDGWPHALLTKNDGTLWGVGFGGYGSGGGLGAGPDQQGANEPILISSERWAYVDAEADYNFLGIKEDGTLWAWGAVSDGNTGIPDRCGLPLLGDAVFYPTQVGADADWVWCLPRAYGAMAIKRDGSMWVWGGNYDGRMGVPDPPTLRLCEPSRVTITEQGAITTPGVVQETT